MKVEIWSDYQCPFCYIGKRRFETALNQFPNKDQIEVIYRSFELDPQAEKEGNESAPVMLSKKYGMSVEEARAMNANITEQAKQEGLTYVLDSMVLTNTFDAHRLTHFAAQQGKMKEMAEALFQAVFTDSKNIGLHDALVELAEGVGLDPQEASAVLQGNRFGEEVQAEEQEAQSLGIRGVPYFVIDRKYALSGAQPTQTFLEALQKAWSEAHPFTVLNATGSDTGDDGSCSDGSCGI